MDLNWKIDSIISLLQNWDVAVLNILQNPEGNGLEQVRETSVNVYVPPQANDNHLACITSDEEVLKR